MGKLVFDSATLAFAGISAKDVEIGRTTVDTLILVFATTVKGGNGGRGN